MFTNARSFNHELCGASWVQTGASRERMFIDSPGSISTKICDTSVILPRSQSDNQICDVSTWDVSSVDDMHNLFSNTNFQGDISKWKVSRVRSMSNMFWAARSYNGDISKWDVSSV